MKRFLIAAVACVVAGCSGPGSSPDSELADAQAEADEAAAMDFSGAPLMACRLLSRDEVQSAIGPLTRDPESPAENSADTADARCLWHSDERTLGLSASREGGAERIGAIQPYAVVEVAGDWEQARLQGCCLLHAVKEEALLSLDFSSARMDLETAAKLMNRALARVHEPLDTP